MHTIKNEIKISCDRPFRFCWIPKRRRKAWFADFGLEDLRTWVAAEAVAAEAEAAATVAAAAAEVRAAAGETAAEVRAAAGETAAAAEVRAAGAAVEKRTELWDHGLGNYEYVIHTGKQKTHFILSEKFETSEILFIEKY